MGHSARPMIHIINPHKLSLLQQNEYATAEHIHQKKTIIGKTGTIYCATKIVIYINPDKQKLHREANELPLIINM